MTFFICFGKFAIENWLPPDGNDGMTSIELNTLLFSPLPPTNSMEFFVTKIKFHVSNSQNLSKLNIWMISGNVIDN